MKSEQKLLTYGLFEENLIHISQVQNGLACNCYCPHCKHALVAKNNPTNIKQSHFAHSTGKECSGAYETALHLLAKEILKRTKTIYAPNYHYDYDPHNQDSIFVTSQPIRNSIYFEEVILEQRITLDSEIVIPDAIGIVKGKEIFIEFANSHFVDHDKKAKLRNSNKACIEIDLTNQLLDEESLISLFNESSADKYWICNPRMDVAYKEYRSHLAELKKKREEAKLKESKDALKKSWEKYHSYKSNKSLQVLNVYNDQVRDCPKKRKALSNLRSKNFYEHPILKEIIDGAYWNGQLYGFIPNGKWIYFKGERVVVFPPDDIKRDEAEKKKLNVFYHGLKIIEQILLSDESFGECGHCIYSVDFLKIESKEFEVCKHPKNY